MVDVDCCVVGAGFAGLTAALRLKLGGGQPRRGLRALGQMCAAVPLDAPWKAKMAAKWNTGQRRRGGWAATCRPGPRITCRRPPALFALHQMASGGEVGFVLRG